MHKLSTGNRLAAGRHGQQLPVDMDHQVAFLSRGLGETLSTVLAFIWLFTGVNSFMGSKVPGLSKLLGAELALKWLLAGVDPHVNLKIRKRSIHQSDLRT